jgi:hypothetical protein
MRCAIVSIIAPIPVSEATMLARSKHIRIMLVLSVLAAIACFAGNPTTFYFFALGPPLTLLLAAGTTAPRLLAGTPL